MINQEVLKYIRAQIDRLITVEKEMAEKEYYTMAAEHAHKRCALEELEYWIQCTCQEEPTTESFFEAKDLVLYCTDNDDSIIHVDQVWTIDWAREVYNLREKVVPFNVLHKQTKAAERLIARRRVPK